MYIPRASTFAWADVEAQKFVEDELRRIGQETAETKTLDLRPTMRAIDRPREGAIIYADGTQYNPGSGEGPYVYKNGVWQPFITGDTGRKKLTSTTAISVAASGGDFTSLQSAMDTLYTNYDFGGQDVTVTSSVTSDTTGLDIKPWVGGGSLSFIGDVATPSNRLISTTNANAITHTRGALQGPLTIRGFKLQTTTNGSGLNFRQPCSLTFNALDFGACATFHMIMQGGAVAHMTGNYNITGSAISHYVAGSLGLILSDAVMTIALSNSPVFNNAFGFGYVAGGGTALFNSSLVTFTGTTGASSRRFKGDTNGTHNTQAGGLNFLPGTIPGTLTDLSSGAQYI